MIRALALVAALGCGGSPGALQPADVATPWCVQGEMRSGEAVEFCSARFSTCSLARSAASRYVHTLRGVTQCFPRRLR